MNFSINRVLSLFFCDIIVYDTYTYSQLLFRKPRSTIIALINMSNTHSLTVYPYNIKKPTLDLANTTYLSMSLLILYFNMSTTVFSSNSTVTRLPWEAFLNMSIIFAAFYFSSNGAVHVICSPINSIMPLLYQHFHTKFFTTFHKPQIQIPISPRATELKALFSLN